MFYAGWLTVFLLTRVIEGPLVQAVLWVSAPLVTGLGCAAGAGALAHLRHTGFRMRRALTWSVAGCAVGALAVYWYGPMLIAVTMLAGGTAAVVVHDMFVPSGPGHDQSPGFDS